MAFEDINFPVFRKYKNNKNFYKIISPGSFEEKQVIGNKITTHFTQATRLPELNHIHDLVYDRSIADEITETEYVKIGKE